jgi:hypothetical protein
MKMDNTKSNQSEKGGDNEDFVVSKEEYAVSNKQLTAQHALLATSSIGERMSCITRNNLNPNPNPSP